MHAHARIAVLLEEPSCFLQALPGGRGWHGDCVPRPANAAPGQDTEATMLTAPEPQLPPKPQGSEAVLPRVALATVPPEWAQQPQSGRRDRPLVEDLDSMWDDAFASW